MRSWKKINISEVFVVVLIQREHLLQKEDEDRREAAVFQEEPSTTDIHLVRGDIFKCCHCSIRLQHREDS